jgi:hypothetical protein
MRALYVTHGRAQRDGVDEGGDDVAVQTGALLQRALQETGVADDQVGPSQQVTVAPQTQRAEGPAGSSSPRAGIRVRRSVTHEAPDEDDELRLRRQVTRSQASRLLQDQQVGRPRPHPIQQNPAESGFKQHGSQVEGHTDGRVRQAQTVVTTWDSPIEDIRVRLAPDAYGLDPVTARQRRQQCPCRNLTAAARPGKAMAGKQY